ncbi:MAG TPA: tyrosine-type recombinase/integrase, partial [Planctomycetota bacterium]|nr:tyrosine-type recombinase/integrase [Planctomycetota bacterium]
MIDRAPASLPPTGSNPSASLVPPALLQQSEAFLQYLQVERGCSSNTTEAYRRDLIKFALYLDSVGVADFANASSAHIETFVALLRGAYLPGTGSTVPVSTSTPITPVSASSAARNLAALKSFYRFLAVEENLKNNPARVIRMPKRKKALPKALTKPEIITLMHVATEPTLAPATPPATATEAEPAAATPTDIDAVWRASLFLRDLAVLELLYATGMRVSELCGLNLTDLNLEGRVAKVTGKGRKQRLCALNETAAGVLKLYIDKGRSLVRPAADEPAVFVSRRGQRVERTAVFRLTKKLARTADLQLPPSEGQFLETRV